MKGIAGSSDNDAEFENRTSKYSAFHKTGYYIFRSDGCDQSELAGRVRLFLARKSSRPAALILTAQPDLHVSASWSRNKRRCQITLDPAGNTNGYRDNRQLLLCVLCFEI